MKTTRVTKLCCFLLCASQLLRLATPVAIAGQPPETSSPSGQNESLLQFTAGGHILGFTEGGMYAATGSHALHVDFVGGSGVQPQAETPASADGKAAPLSRVLYPNLWRGISLTVDASPGGILRSTYQIEAGADTRAIQLRYNAPLAVNPDGSLSISFETGTLNESAPRAWQVIGGVQSPVPVSFTRHADVVGFSVGWYDPRYPLTIDPTLTWNTFLGGGGPDYGNAITLDDSGNVYVAGSSSATWGSPVRLYTASAGDAFVARLDSSGALQWNTFLGGSGNDSGTGIAVDGSGNVYLAGTSSSDWGTPVRAYSANGDAFAARLDASGALQWNTFLGGSWTDSGTGIAVDGSGNPYLAGTSNSTWGAPVRAHSGAPDAFAARLDASGALQWNTFLGNSNFDEGHAISVDEASNVYLTGYSSATWGAPVRPYSASWDAFAVKLDSSGALQWNTFLGGSSLDYGNSITADDDGNVYLAGVSLDTWGSPVRAYSVSHDAFTVKLDSNGALQWNTFLGGGGSDGGYGISVDGSGNVYVSGLSDATWGSPVRPYSGDRDAFAARLDSSGALQWNTFLGWSGGDEGYAIVADASGNSFVAGCSLTSWGSPLRPYTSGYDGFSARLNSSGALQWNTFLGGRGGGGNGHDYGYAMALDGDGNVYVAGTSRETWGLPVRAHTTGTWDAFAAKLDTSGALQWNTFLGGSGVDSGYGIGVDGSGNVYVIGSSYPWDCSPVSCTVRPFDPDPSNLQDAFVTKLDSSGALQWLTFLGGSESDNGKSIAVDETGNAYVAGYSYASWGSPVRSFTGDLDAFAARLDSSGALQWNTFLGGNASDKGFSIAVDEGGNVFVAGSSQSTWGAPVRPHAPYANADAFAARLDSSGLLQWNTFLGSEATDNGYSIAVDEGGYVYVAGTSEGLPWGCSPETCTVRDTTGASDSFVARLDSGGALQWNTFLGSGGIIGVPDVDRGYSITLDGSSNVYVTGSSNVTWGYPVRAYTGDSDAYAAKMDSSGALLWNTFLGGMGSDDGNAIAVDSSGNTTVAGTSTADWGSPVRPYNGSEDAFAAMLPQPAGQAPAAFDKAAPANGATVVSTSPTLSWAASSGATSYEYCYDTTKDNRCASWMTTSTISVTLSGLSPNTTYYWNVVAINSFGETYSNRFQSAYWSFTTGNPPGAFAKTSPANGASGVSTSPTLSWGLSNGATSYEYCYDLTDDNACTNWTSNGTGTSIALSGLSNNTTYYWHVRAINSDGATYSDGSATAFWSFTTGNLPGVFAKASPLNGATGVSTSPILSWGLSNGAASYAYCYDLTNDNACSNWTSNGASTSVALSGLSDNTTYYWHVRATNSYGTTYADGSATAFWSFSTSNLPGAFGKDSPANGASGVSTSPTLSWGLSNGATGYEYCYDLTDDNACTSWTSNGTGTSIALSGLSDNTTYYWHVRATNSDGPTYSDGSSTAFWSFTTGNLPGAFGKASPLNGATGVSISPILSWGLSNGATSYDYCYDLTDDNACSNWTDNGASASIALSGLTPNATYYWHVRASNSHGSTYSDGSATAYWSFTTGNAAGLALTWNTFLGSSITDYGRSIAVDEAGNVYVTGISSDSWGSPIRAFSGDWDAFVARLDASGNLLWNTFLGGIGMDYGYAIAVDGGGNINVAGYSLYSWGRPYALIR